MEQVLVFWPTDELEAIGEAAAFDAGRLIADERAWVRRRVEKFRFIDGSRVRRSMSVDFVTPTSQRRVLLIPLALPRKAPLRDLDVTDEAGNALTVLTRDENAAISREILEQYARETLRRTRRFARLHDDLFFDFADLAGHRYEGERPSDVQRARRVQAALDLFRDAVRLTAPATEAAQQRQVLWLDRDMRAFIHLLADRYVSFRPPSGERRRAPAGEDHVRGGDRAKGGREFLRPHHAWLDYAPRRTCSRTALALVRHERPLRREQLPRRSRAASRSCCRTRAAEPNDRVPEVNTQVPPCFARGGELKLSAPPDAITRCLQWVGDLLAGALGVAPAASRGQTHARHAGQR